MPRFVAAFEFALALSFLGAMGFQFSRLFGKSQRYLRALATLVAFPIAFLSTQLIRQTIFELRSDGAISSQMDTCTFALWPILFVIASFVLVILAEGYAALGMLQAGRSPERLSSGTIVSRSLILAHNTFRGIRRRVRVDQLGRLAHQSALPVMPFASPR